MICIIESNFKILFKDYKVKQRHKAMPYIKKICEKHLHLWCQYEEIAS